MLHYALYSFLNETLAYAQEAAGAAAPKGPNLMEVLVMPAGFLVIMYFFMIRPQQKKAKEHADLLTQLKPGDEVVTSGGIIGKVRSVADGFVALEVAQNTVIKVLKPNVSGLSKPNSAKEGAKDAAKVST
jgi:preprotein translocase subunit YajC